MEMILRPSFPVLFFVGILLTACVTSGQDVNEGGSTESIEPQPEEKSEGPEDTVTEIEVVQSLIEQDSISGEQVIIKEPLGDIFYHTSSIPSTLFEDNVTDTGPDIDILDIQPDLVTEPATDYVVSEEVYNQTAQEIEKLIYELNDIIKSSNFRAWKRYLTPAYIDKYDSTEDLNEYTELYKKKGYDIKLTTLEDYFYYLVVMSRSEPNLHHIDFLSSDRIIAWAEYKNQLGILYKLEKVNGEWKITEW